CSRTSRKKHRVAAILPECKSSINDWIRRDHRVGACYEGAEMTSLGFSRLVLGAGSEGNGVADRREVNLVNCSDVDRTSVGNCIDEPHPCQRRETWISNLIRAAAQERSGADHERNETRKTHKQYSRRRLFV